MSKNWPKSHARISLRICKIISMHNVKKFFFLFLAIVWESISGSFLPFCIVLSSLLPSFVLSSKLCFYRRPLWIARQNVIRQAVDESILSFNDQPTWCAFYMASYTFKGNQWKANNAGSLRAACLMAGCAQRLFVNMHGSVVCRAALYCIRLNERDCKGGSVWDKEWLTYESTIVLLHSHTHTHAS